jgi:2'-5' RNA ligase
MKLHELITEFKRDEMPDGIYVALRFDEETKQQVRDFLKNNNIPNPINVDKLHTTLLYSKKNVPNLKVRGQLDPALELEPKNFEIFPTQNNKNALVLKLHNDDIVKRHQEFLNMGGTSDYPEFKPHVTLSYDVGDEFSIDSLSNYQFKPFKAVEEYAEPLNLHWSDKDGK